MWNISPLLTRFLTYFTSRVFFFYIFLGGPPWSGYPAVSVVWVHGWWSLQSSVSPYTYVKGHTSVRHSPGTKKIIFCRILQLKLIFKMHMKIMINSYNLTKNENFQVTNIKSSNIQECIKSAKHFIQLLELECAKKC